MFYMQFSIFQKNMKSRNGKIGVISSGRDDVIHKMPGVDVVKSRGAGYKALCVILGHVDCYPLTQAACYKWDTCAPHALLLSLGGGLIDLQQAITHSGIFYKPYTIHNWMLTHITLNYLLSFFDKNWLQKTTIFNHNFPASRKR